MVGTLELDDLVAPCDGAGQAQGGVGGLGARVGQQDALGRWHVPGDRLGQLDLYVGHAGADNIEAVHRVADGGVDGRVVVAEDDRAEGGVVVEVALPVGVGEVCASGVDDHHRPGQRAVDRVDPTGDDAARPFRQVDIALDSGHAIPPSIAQNVKRKSGGALCFTLY